MANRSAWEEQGYYAPLLRADRLIIAWEWLRRNPGYRAAVNAGGGNCAAEPWGLHRLIDPDVAAPRARPVWTSRATRHLICCHAHSDAHSDEVLDLRELGDLLTIERSDCGEHLLICDGIRAIRLDVASGTVAQGPVTLRYELAGLASAEAQLLALRRFLALAKTAHFSPMLHRPEQRSWRWVRELRTWDAIVNGATQRDIAAKLLAREDLGGNWRLNSPSLRLQAQRLVRRARYMADKGYLDLLHPPGAVPTPG